MKSSKKDTHIPLLMLGNPNVGKSALFNRLTGANAVVSNYPGTTVEYTSGCLTVSKQSYDIIDVPGTYSLKPRDGAEEVAVQLLNTHPDAVVLMVLDATRVERGLFLTLEVLERGFSVIIALNMIDSAHDRHISLDSHHLQEILGVPVVPTSAISGEGIRALAEMIRKARPADVRHVEARAKGISPEGSGSSGCMGCCGCCGGL